MLNRLVTAPDGVEWIVGRAFLFGPPRYIGFRFGRGRAQFERPRVRRVPLTNRQPQSPTATVAAWSDPAAGRSRTAAGSSAATAAGGGPTHRRRGFRHRGGTIFLPVGAPGGRSWSGLGGSGSGSSWSRSGGGGTRSFESAATVGTGSSFGRSGSGSSSGKGKGGAAGGLAGLGALLVKVAKFALIAIAIAVATWLTIFVLVPALIFGVWGVLIGLAIVRHGLFRQPWIVEARENRPAPNVLGWAVQGWRQSRAVIDEVADAIAEGSEPRPLTATPIRLDRPQDSRR